MRLFTRVINRLFPGLADPAGILSWSTEMAGYIVLGVLAVAALWVLAIYNGLVTLKQSAAQAFADIDVQMNLRADLIPNLVETVKGYAAHEKSTLDAVISARGAAVAARDPAEQAQAQASLSGALGRLMVLAESYPDLKANRNFQALQDQLADIEAKLAAARRFFNNAIREYNAAAQSFPALLFALNLGFGEAAFFDVGDAKCVALNTTPSVKF
jgi:LemA protein